MVRFFENEPYSPIEYAYKVESVLYKGKSRYQEILVLENAYFGKILVLDGIVQLTEKDEFFYHEMLTHVAMHAHPDPHRVAVIGGGDGGVVREVLKHGTVEKIYFVEIDEEVVKISRKFFPTVSSGIDDSRVELKIMDGADFMRDHAEAIDVIIVDSTDIIGFARSLFTEDFFRSVLNALQPEGLFVTHSESLHFHLDIVVEVQQILKRAFPLVHLYTAPLATYPGNWWTFAIGSRALDPRDMRRPFEIDARYYDEEIHRQAFLTPKLYGKLIWGKLDW
ncbi:MAG: polyamine aminopropyltransferase [Deltaproteobacteria bacterium]|nr:polyamine aminopropyltransferase [Deltaproteobacteria bacterium]